VRPLEVDILVAFDITCLQVRPELCEAPFITTLVATIVFGYQMNKLDGEYEAEAAQEQSVR